TDPRNELHDPQFPHISNPVVLRALHELRKVVNAIVRKYGRPEAIHVEMARDLKMNSQKRKEHRAKALKHEKEREKAKEFIESQGMIATRDAILVHRLWEEQNKTCIYSGEIIPASILFSGRG